ncbi:MAG: glycosyltransferase family 2 protein, partial [Candidatus Omnitrophota bacterium]
RHHPGLLRFSYYFLISLFVFQAFLSYLSTFAAIRRRHYQDRPLARHQQIPKSTFIVSAYLPNEVSVIEQTLLNLLKNVVRPEAGIEVILAYNTPHLETLELRLRELALDHSELILANAYGSRSKSENLNYAIGLASGSMIVLLDADHQVAPDCLRRAWRWLDAGYDIVQGRCKIRNGSDNALTALIEIEFEAIYSVSHAAKSLLFDCALFGGSNGYWKKQVLNETRFHHDCLTEDIDSTLRATLAGRRIVHDSSIVSTELAPESMGTFWFQRKRWAQGWFQCSLRYQLRIWLTRFLNPAQKFMWTTLLLWRIVYDILSHFLWPVVFAYWLTRGHISFPMNAYVWFSVCFTMFSGPFEALAARLNSVDPRPPLWQYLYYSTLAFPYMLFKNIIQTVAVGDELLGRREWVVSERKA